MIANDPKHDLVLIEWRPHACINHRAHIFSCKNTMGPGLYLHTNWFMQAVYVLAVSMNAVAQVGGVAGILIGPESGCMSTSEDHVLGVERSCAFALVFVPPLAFDLPFLLLISGGMQVCRRKGSIRSCLGCHFNSLDLKAENIFFNQLKLLKSRELHFHTILYTHLS